MVRLAKVMIVVATIFLVIAIWGKVVSVNRIMPGSFYINWIKLTDTGLLFSIAISLLKRDK